MVQTNNLNPIFIVTVDTEEEWNWNGPLPTPPFSTKNIKAIPKFQKLCKELHVVPTYFVDYAVAENVENSEILSYYFTSSECDIGSHLHPWCTPPISEEISEYNSHALNLDIELFERKMESLTQLIQNRFKVHPFSFRSGRWGLNGEMLKVLSKLGYQVDSSVRPFYEDQYFSYRHAPTYPYWPSFDNILSQDDTQKEILEIPTTSGYNFPWFESLDRAHNILSQYPINKLRIIGVLWKLGLMRKITVTPEGNNASDICRCIDMSVRRGDPVIGMFFHSSDLLPGCTEYVKNKDDETEFYKKIEYCVRYAQSKYNAEFLSMRQAYERLKVV